jgi:hypothetical protein
MEDWQYRVLEERDELNLKIDKLADFLNRTTFFDKTLILKAQLAAMNAYRDILDIRVSHWEAPMLTPNNQTR